MSDDILLVKQSGAVAEVTLNDPGKLNALSDEMLGSLTGALIRLGGDPSVRVVILKAVGKAFCAGHDLKQMTAARAAADGGAEYFADLFRRCSAMMLAIRDLPQPVIAQVQGVAAAAGCQLVAACDLAVAADHTRFGVNGVNIGLFCSTPMVALSRNISRKKAFEMLTTGDFIDAAEAERFGLVNKICPADQLDATTRAMADKIAAKLARAVRYGKPAFYAQLELGLGEAYEFAGAVMAANMMETDTAEGIDAFLAKRPPSYSDQ